MAKTQFSLSLLAPPAFCTEWEWSGIDAFVAAVVHPSGQALVQSPQGLFEELRLKPVNTLDWFAPGTTISIAADDTDCRFFPLIASSPAPEISPILLDPFYLGRNLANGANEDNQSSPLISVNGLGVALFIARPQSWQNGRNDVIFARLFHGSILLAETSLPYEMILLAEPDPIQTTTPVFKIIFASYAREDLEIVEAVSSIIEASGLAEFRWDLKILRSGDVWSKVILTQIEKADSFQLFWSASAKKSRYVKLEWQHALSLERQAFIKPVYWEQPMPIPPRKLKHLQFSKILVSRPAGPVP
jgi:hypothetical protein